MIEEIGMSPTQVGTVLAANSAAQMLGAIFFGRCSDAVGRRPLVLFGWSWAFLGSTAMAFCYTFTHILIVRVVQGLSGGTMAICQSYMLDAVPPHKQPQFLGLFGGVTSIAFVFGPLLGATLIALGTDRRYIFIVSGLLALIGMIF